MDNCLVSLAAFKKVRSCLSSSTCPFPSFECWWSTECIRLDNSTGWKLTQQAKGQFSARQILSPAGHATRQSASKHIPHSGLPVFLYSRALFVFCSLLRSRLSSAAPTQPGVHTEGSLQEEAQPHMNWWTHAETKFGFEGLNSPHSLPT